MTWMSLRRFLLSFRSSKGSSGNSSKTPEEADSITESARRSRALFLKELDMSPAPVSHSEPGPQRHSDQLDDARREAVIDNPETIGTTAGTLKEDIKQRQKQEAFTSIFKGSPEPFIRNSDDIDELKHTYLLPTFKPTIVKEPFTKNHELMDDMLDAVLTLRSFPCARDIAKNIEAVAQATASGVKGRDLVASLTHPAPRDIEARQDDAKPIVKGHTAIELFDAHHKALHFFYLRFLVNAGIYDLPQYNFTIDDVDRLYTCGIIGLDDLDNVLLGSMMGHGAFRRLARTYGFPQIDLAVIPPRGPWTIPIDRCRRPTREEICEYIASSERTRFNRRYTLPWCRIAAFERPVMSREYIQHRLERDGFWGLKRMARIDDDEADGLFRNKDTTFIPQEIYLAETRTSLEEQPTEPVLGTYHHRQTLSAVATPTPSPLSSSPDAADTAHPSTRGRAESKGKKRARSRSVSIETSDDDSARRSRRRLSEPEPIASTAACASSDSSPPVPSTITKALSKGKKRERDHEVDTKVLSESSPAKKMKNTEGAARRFPVETESLPGHASESDVRTTASLSGSHDSTPAMSISPPAEQNVPAAGETVSGSFNPSPADHLQHNSLSTRPTLVIDHETGTVAVHTRGKLISMDHIRIEVPPDFEKGPVHALMFDGLIVPSWVESCRRPEIPISAAEAWRDKQSQLQAASGSQAQAQASDGALDSSSSQTEESRNPLKRQHMIYLDEKYPQFHPPYYGKMLTRERYVVS